VKAVLSAEKAALSRRDMAFAIPAYYYVLPALVADVEVIGFAQVFDHTDLAVKTSEPLRDSRMCSARRPSVMLSPARKPLPSTAARMLLLFSSAVTPHGRQRR
jgi:hypothetical protein